MVNEEFEKDLAEAREYTAKEMQSRSGSNTVRQLKYAQMFAKRYEDALLYAPGLGWLFWTGTHWAKDPAEVQTFKSLVELLEYARNELEAVDDKAGIREIDNCQTSSALDGILKIASRLLTVPADEMDAKPWLLNCANGTLDLKTLELREHDPGDRLMKITRASYTPGARSDVWEEFLSSSLPDPDVRAYLARFVGLSLIGEVIAHEFHIFTGATRNGKGTFYGAVLHALGSYGGVMVPELLASKKTSSGNEANPGLMKLRGERFVVASETDRQLRVDAALMKRLTGGDTIAARHLFKDLIEFQPSHSLLLVTNHLPKVPGDDPAVWERIRVIPFDVVIPKEKRNDQLKTQLEGEADAILSWAIEGLRDWKVVGMNPPAAVRAAGAEYQKASDPISEFIKERCVFGPDLKVPFNDIWLAFQLWAANQERDIDADDNRKVPLAHALTKAGSRADKGRPRGGGKTVAMRIGVALKGDEDGNPALAGI